MTITTSAPRIVDLSFPIRNSPEGTPAFQQVSISYSNDAAGAREAEQLTGVPRRLMRNGEAWATETFTQLLSKSTATTVSPWVVTLEALAPFRCAAFARSEGNPAPLPYLYAERDQQNGGLDVTLEIHFSSARMRARELAPVRLSRTSTRHLYWTPAQLLAHHTSNGCNMNIGDLLATGTVSGPSEDARGCMLELSWGGRDPLELPGGEQRTYVENGDEVIFSGYCEREGYRRIGLGECRGIVDA